MRKIITLILTTLLLLQGCVLYEKTPSRLNEVENQGKVKVIMNNGSIKKYMSLTYRDETYYGVFSSGLEDKLDSALIQSVYLKNDKASKEGTIILFSLLFLFAAFYFSI